MKGAKDIRKCVSIFILSTLLSILTLPFSLKTSFAQEQFYHPNTLILPHVESNEDFFTGLSLLNTGDVSSEVKLISYSKNGRVLGEQRDIVLQPGARYLSSVADIFGYEVALNVSWIKVEYSGELKGFGLLGNDNQLAKIPLQNEGKETIILPYVISGDGLFTQIYLLNVGSQVVSYAITAYDRDGSMLIKVDHDIPLVSGQKLIDYISDLFGPEVSQEISWIKVESNGNLIGLGLAGTTDRLFSIPME